MKICLHVKLEKMAKKLKMISFWRTVLALDIMYSHLAIEYRALIGWTHLTNAHRSVQLISFLSLHSLYTHVCMPRLDRSTLNRQTVIVAWPYIRLMQHLHCRVVIICDIPAFELILLVVLQTNVNFHALHVIKIPFRCCLHVQLKRACNKNLSLIHIWRCRRSYACRSRWSPYH